MVLFLEIITFFLSTLLIIHSTRYRGSKFTILFFITGLILGFARENFVAAISDLYRYNPDAFRLWFFNAPLILGVFWSFTTYISFSLAQDIVNGNLLGKKRLTSIFLIAMAFMAAYASFNEAFGSSLNMVIWKFTPDVAIWGGTPLMVLFGYAAMGAILMGGVLLIYFRRWAFWTKFIVAIASVPLMIVLHLTFLKLVRIGISFIA